MPNLGAAGDRNAAAAVLFEIDDSVRSVDALAVNPGEWRAMRVVLCRTAAARINRNAGRFQFRACFGVRIARVGEYRRGEREHNQYRTSVHDGEQYAKVKRMFILIVD